MKTEKTLLLRLYFYNYGMKPLCVATEWDDKGQPLLRKWEGRQ